jgi:hypothetical protein
VAEKHVVTIKGEAYNLPPWNAGQMRRQVDPMLQETKALLEQAGIIQSGQAPVPALLLDLSMRQRNVARAQAELVLAALQNQYPNLTLDDVETLTPARIAQVFNELLLLTCSGSNEPGESLPPAPKKRSR